MDKVRSVFRIGMPLMISTIILLFLVVALVDITTSEKLHICDNYAYSINIYGQAVSIINLSDNSEEGGYITNANAYSLDYKDDFIYLACGNYGLDIVNVSDKTNPQHVGRYNTDGKAVDIKVVEDYAYIADDNNGLVILNINDKNNPTYVGAYNNISEAKYVELNGNYAFILMNNGYVIVDVKNKNYPEMISNITIENVRLIRVKGNFLYLMSYDGFIVSNITNIETPIIEARYYTDIPVWMEIKDEYLYLYSPFGPFSIIDVIDISKNRNFSKVMEYKVLDKDIYNYVIFGDCIYFWNGVFIPKLDMRKYAWIEDISPNPAIVTNNIHFTGHGPHLKTINITNYVWYSDTDGEFYNGTDSTFYYDGLSFGKHTIHLRTKDSNNVWSLNTSTPLMIDLLKCDYIGGLGGNINDIAVEGNYLYTCTQHGLSIYDISSPLDLHEVGFIHIECSNLDDLVVDENFAFITYDKGLYIVDISTKNNPIIKGHYHDNNNYIVGLRIKEDYAYLANLRTGLTIVDVKDKENPKLLNHFSVYGGINDVEVYEDYAYVCLHEYFKVLIIDIQDIHNPVSIGNYTTNYFPISIKIQDNYAYIVDGGLDIVDIINNSNPQKVGRYDSRTFSEVWLRGNNIYIGGRPPVSLGFAIVDVTDANNPIEVGHLNDFHGCQMAFYSDYAFAIYGPTMSIINIHNENEPMVFRVYNNIYRANDMVKDNDFIYVGDYDGFVIVDVIDKMKPKEIGKYNLSGSVEGVTISEEHAFIINDEGTLLILDISNKENPTKISQLTIEGTLTDIKVSGNYLFITEKDYGLIIVDISDVMNPKEIGRYDTQSSGTYGVYVSDNYAFIADSFKGLLIVDVSNKINPFYLGGYQTAGDANNVFVCDNYAYVADSGNGFVIVDVNNKSNPFYIGEYDTDGNAYDVFVQGDYAYVADSENGLVIVDVNNKSNPFYVGSCGLGYFTYEAIASGKYIYVRENKYGLLILQIPLPGIPSGIIEDITPNPAQHPEVVYFSGYGSDDGEITQYAWRSSIDGEFYNGTESEITYNDLSIGTHTIYFKVMDDNGTWSEEAISILEIVRESFITLTFEQNEIKSHRGETKRVSFVVNSNSNEDARCILRARLDGNPTDWISFHDLDGTEISTLFILSPGSEVDLNAKISIPNVVIVGNYVISIYVCDTDSNVISNFYNITLDINLKENGDTTSKGNGDGDGQNIFIIVGVGLAAVIVLLAGIMIMKKRKNSIIDTMFTPTTPSQQSSQPPPQQPPSKESTQEQQMPPLEVPMEMDASWFCAKCGSKQKADYAFCMGCGNKRRG